LKTILIYFIFLNILLTNSVNSGFSQVFTSIDEALKNPTKCIELDLNSQDLSELPSDFAKFLNLKKLVLSNNNFAEIPDVVFQLKNLEELHLQGALTYFEKYEKDILLTTISEKISELPNLQLLNLSYNDLTVLPAELSELKNLRVLNIYHNRINQSSDLNIIATVASLKELNIGGNDLKQLPESFAKLTNLNNLYIDNSYSEGVAVGETLSDFPAVVLQLSNLKELSLTGQAIKTIPKNINKLSNLEVLWLNDNPFLGLPESFGDLSKLKHLNISYYCVPDTTPCTRAFKLPKSFCKLSNLNEFTAYGRNIKPADAKRLKSCLKTEISY